jgi:hypothetical protein
MKFYPIILKYVTILWISLLSEGISHRTRCHRGPASVWVAKYRWNRKHDDVYFCCFKTLWVEIWHVWSLDIALFMAICRLCPLILNFFNHLMQVGSILSRWELNPFLSLCSGLNPCVSPKAHDWNKRKSASFLLHSDILVFFINKIWEGKDIDIADLVHDIWMNMQISTWYNKQLKENTFVAKLFLKRSSP